MDTGLLLTSLLGAAVLMPLASFVVILCFGPMMGKGGKQAGVCATLAILTSCILSYAALGVWLYHHAPVASTHGSHAAHGEGEHGEGEHGETHDEPAAGENASTGLTAAHLTQTVAEEETPAETPDETVGGEAADGHDEAHGGEHAEGHGGHDDHASEPGPSYFREIYTLAKFGRGALTISAYVDSLTVCMFAMVTLIASCIHFYAMGYMHDELTDDYVDHEVHMADGSHLHRPGRFHRFFQALSLFCFSMLGLVLSGNIAMTFVFWELVGICSYFLIGFYVERKSASTAANKAFIVNRVGDFGMIIGLMALWGSLGTFSFGGDDGIFSLVRPAANNYALQVPDGMVRAAATTQVTATVRATLGPDVSQAAIDEAIQAKIPEWREAMGENEPGRAARWLLIIAGVGIFCGCVGKSAQFPLHVWLPDAMEGPTPVSALVHSATMVAAGVFLVGRFYPVFCPEVLLVIAVVGTITLFLAATIAIVATDIKRVLAYSTVSQLGYMMLALGLGGWLAGILHLFTHAFFKSLLFMCSGSVIHAVHTNEMPEMGGLRKKMPWTAYTMLVGCLAIAGAGLPFTFALGGQPVGLGLSGYYSKDAILEQALSFRNSNPAWGTFFFIAAAGGAAITAFYMFRLWYLTFAGTPRNLDRYEHAHESPPIMYRPLILLATLAVAAAWGPREAMVGSIVALVLFAVLRSLSKDTPEDSHAHAGHGHGHDHGHDAHGHGHDSHGHDSHGHDSHGHDAHGHAHHGWNPLEVALGIAGIVFIFSLVWLKYDGVTLANLLEQARPAGTLATQEAALTPMVWPNEHLSHEPAIKVPATLIAFSTALAGFLLSTMFYGLRKLDAAEAKRTFAPIHHFLQNKWWFDELYAVLFIRPTHVVSHWISNIDRRLIDGLIDGIAWCVRTFSNFWERLADRTIVDGFVNLLAARTYGLGLTLRKAQTGNLRQYVMFIVIGTIAVFMLASFWRYALAN